MKGYSASDVARMLELPVAQIRSYARAGFLQPSRGSRGEMRFSFQDLVLLRTAKGLSTARIPPKKIRTALRKLKERLPGGRPLTAVQIAALGDQIVVRDGSHLWDPESGQGCFDFEFSGTTAEVAPLSRRAPAEVRFGPEPVGSDEQMAAGDWFELGNELEAADPEHARSAYARTLELDPDHVEARVNLGRLLHEAGEPAEAESQYRRALALRPGDPTALFNLGVSLEDLGRAEDAALAYEEALESDPGCADAHYNLGRLYGEQGRGAESLQHFNAYRRLTRTD